MNRLSDGGWWILRAGGERKEGVDHDGGAESMLLAGGLLQLIWEAGRDRPWIAEESDVTVVLDAALLGGRPASEEDASTILRQYRGQGEDVLRGLTGTFAVAISDDRHERLLCARDRLGIYPLFFVHGSDCSAVSIDRDALARWCGRQDINRMWLLSYLTEIWPDADETAYEAVRRVPPGHTLVFDRGCSSIRRYWHPEEEAPGTAPRDGREAVERFAALLDSAVAGPLGMGPAAVLLSGGIDSSSVAAAATGVARATSAPLPSAMSLVYPGEADEQAMQRRIAADLGMAQTFLRVESLAGLRGLVRATLDLNRGLSLPAPGPWYAVSESIAAQADGRGWRVMLTGEGGDDWLVPAARYAASRVLAGDVRGLYRLWNARRRDFPGGGGRTAARWVLWDWSLAPLLRAALRGPLDRLTPCRVQAYRRGRLAGELHDWMEPELCQVLVDRELARGLRPGVRALHQDERRGALDYPRLSHFLEREFGESRRSGIAVVHPLLDDRMVQFLYGLSPVWLDLNGETKGLAVALLQQRLPSLQGRWPRKPLATSFFRTLMESEGRAVLRELGPPTALSKLGIVDAKLFDAFARAPHASRTLVEIQLVWRVLSLETWLRPRIVPIAERERSA
jgi:asparagine synthetase B (glutamine-hydrolysing)